MTSGEREPTDEELEELLRRAGPEAPDALRFEQARLAFLAGGEGRSRRPGGERREPVMPPRDLHERPSDGPSERNGEPDGFADWIATHAPLERPSPALVGQARLSFLSAVAGENPVPRRARRSFRALVVTLAAAAVLLVTLLPKSARWTVRMSGPVRFAEREYVLGEEERLAAALEQSGVLESLDSVVQVTLGRTLDLELKAGVALALPALPELDGLAPVAFELTQGETFLHTAPAYAGNPIRVRTAYGEVELHGTTVGVLVDELGTCLCVADGTARLASPEVPGGGQSVGPRHSFRVWEDRSRMAKLEPFPTDERAPEYGHTRELLGFLARF